jgi:hypothetical protein
MRDLSIFPLPLDTDTSILEDEGAAYIATELTLGYDVSGDLMSHSTDDSSACLQKVMRILLSKKGSVPSAPTFGSNLHRLLIGYSPDTVVEDVILILLDVENQCKVTDVSDTAPLNSQLKTLELLDIDVSVPNQIKISLGVTTVSGIALAFDLNI